MLYRQPLPGVPAEAAIGLFFVSPGRPGAHSGALLCSEMRRVRRWVANWRLRCISHGHTFYEESFVNPQQPFFLVFRVEAKPRRILHANASGVLSTNPAFFPPQTSRHRGCGRFAGEKMRSHIPHPYHARESHAWLSFRASSATTWQVCRVANWRLRLRTGRELNLSQLPSIRVGLRARDRNTTNCVRSQAIRRSLARLRPF